VLDDELPTVAELKASVVFVKMPVVVLMDNRLSSDERVLYMWLAHMDRVFRGRLYPSQVYLEGVTGFKRTAIQSYLRKFRALGLITAKKRGFSGNNDYDIVPIETAYPTVAIEASKRLPAKGDILQPGRTLGPKNLAKWWSSLSEAQGAIGRQLCAARNKVFNYDSREIRKLKQFLYSAPELFEKATPEGSWGESPKFELDWVASRPIEIITKPNFRLTIDASEMAVLALAEGVELVRQDKIYKFAERGLVIVRSGDDIGLLNIQTPLTRLATI
jgi:hypothetical protein